MFRYGFFCTVSLTLMLLMSACSTNTPVVKERFFFPPSPAEPKIEYIRGYFSDRDLKSEKNSFFNEYVLGDTRPKAMFSTPVDVASDGKGRVFVADAGARQVFVLDLVNHTFRPLSSVVQGGGMQRSFGFPFSVTVADDGRLYVSDVIAKSVDVFNENEKYLFSIGNSELVRPTAVAVDMQRKVIYVLDTAMHRLMKFGLQGELLGIFGERGNEPGQFNYPTDIDVDDQGYLYVLDSLNARVQIFDENGVFLRMFGERGTADGSFDIPKNLAVSTAGQVYVTDALAHKLVIFSDEGQLLLRIGGKSVVKKGISPGGFYLPRGVDVDAAGGIWVADSLNRIVHRFQFLTSQYLSENPITPAP